MQKLNKDINVNGNNILVDLTKGDGPLSGGQFRQEPAEKKGRCGDNTERQVEVVVVSKVLSGGKSSGKEGKPRSFEDEMIMADLRLDFYKNKKSKTSFSCQTTSLRY